MAIQDNNTRMHWKASVPPDIQVLRHAGAGHRSLWFEARQQRLGRVVAIKNLRPLLAGNAMFRESFLSAARQAAALVHPVVLRIFDIYPEHASIAVQWCADTPLAGMKAGLGPLQALHMAHAVADCLLCLHTTGRAHGSLAPGNIFLGENGRVRMDDFFQPPVLTDGALRWVAAQEFTAPEVLDGAVPDWRSDYYSLGKVVEFAVAPERMTQDLLRFVEGVCSPDPADRGTDPTMLAGTIDRLRQLAELDSGDTGAAAGEKRTYLRIPADFDIHLAPCCVPPAKTRSILLKAANMSQSGVFVQTDDSRFVPGEVVELGIGMGGQSVRVLGMVRWTTRPPCTPGVGVQFMEVERGAREKLQTLLAARVGPQAT